MTVIVPSLLASHPSLPASNVKELIAHIKTRPGQMQFASAGVGSMPHLMMEFFVSSADPSPSAPPAAFAVLIRSEVRKWAKVIRDAGVQPE